MFMVMETVTGVKKVMFHGDNSIPRLPMDSVGVLPM